MACGVNRSDQVVPGVDGCRVRFGARYVAVAELPAVVGVVVQDARSSVASTVAPGHDVLFGTAGRRPDPRLQREPLRPCAWCKSGERVRQESAGSRVAAQDAIEPDRPVSSERSRLVESWCRPSAQLAVVPARFGACRGKTPVRNRPVAHDAAAIAATARGRDAARGPHFHGSEQRLIGCRAVFARRTASDVHVAHGDARTGAVGRRDRRTGRRWRRALVVAAATNRRDCHCEDNRGSSHVHSDATVRRTVPS